MDEIVIGEGNLFGKGVYAGRKFEKGEVVIKYNLKVLSEDDYKNLSEEELHFVHRHWGTRYLYGKPERFVNHSPNPNTLPDIQNKCDIATRNIKAGEEITTDATKDDI